MGVLVQQILLIPIGLRIPKAKPNLDVLFKVSQNHNNWTSNSSLFASYSYNFPKYTVPWTPRVCGVATPPPTICDIGQAFSYFILKQLQI